MTKHASCTISHVSLHYKTQSFQCRKTVVFCLHLDECSYHKLGNNQLCELCFKLKSLCYRRGQFLFFSPFFVNLCRGLTFFILPKQIAFFFFFSWWDFFPPLQPEDVKKCKNNQFQLKDGCILDWVNKVTVHWQKVLCIGFFIGLKLPAPINQCTGLLLSQCFQTATRKYHALKCNESYQ